MLVRRLRGGDIIQTLDFENGLGGLPSRTRQAFDQHNAQTGMVDDLLEAAILQRGVLLGLSIFEYGL
jgi:hypothetical protein